MPTATLPTFSALPEPPRPYASRREQDRYLRQAFYSHSRTFSLATRLLPRAERLPVATLYLYCRTVDTLADDRVFTIGPEQAGLEVEQMRTDLDATLDGHPPTGGPNAFLWTRLAKVHQRYGLLHHPLHQLLDGARWDLDGRPICTLDDLMAYSDLVAGSVGAMMLPFLVRDRADLEPLDAPARALGTAMQITNILRDVGEDHRDLGRTYLPLDQLHEAGIDLSTLSPSDERWPEYVSMIESLMSSAESLYGVAEHGIEALRPSAQLGIKAAARMYREILNGVRANGYDNLTRRAFVPLGRKLRLTVDSGAYSARRARLAARLY